MAVLSAVHAVCSTFSCATLYVCVSARLFTSECGITLFTAVLMCLCVFCWQDAGELSDDSVDEIAHILETELQPSLSALPSSGRSDSPSDITCIETQSNPVRVELQGRLSPENPTETPDVRLSSAHKSLLCDAMKLEPLKTDAAPASSDEPYLPSSEADSSEVATFPLPAQAMICSETSLAKTCQLKLETTSFSALSNASPASVEYPRLSSSKAVNHLDSSEVVSFQLPAEEVVCSEMSDTSTYQLQLEPTAPGALSEATVSSAVPPALLSEAGTCQLLSEAATYSKAPEANTSCGVSESTVCSPAASTVTDQFAARALSSAESEAPTFPPQLEAVTCVAPLDGLISLSSSPVPAESVSSVPLQSSAEVSAPPVLPENMICHAVPEPMNVADEAVTCVVSLEGLICPPLLSLSVAAELPSCFPSSEIVIKTLTSPTLSEDVICHAMPEVAVTVPDEPLVSEPSTSEVAPETVSRELWTSSEAIDKLELSKVDDVSVCPLSIQLSDALMESVLEHSENKAAPETVNREPCTSSEAVDELELSKTDVAVDTVSVCDGLSTVSSDTLAELSVSETGIAVTVMEQDEPCTVSSDALAVSETGGAVTAVERDEPCTVFLDAAATSMAKLEPPDTDVPVVAVSSHSTDSLSVTLTPVQTKDASTAIIRQDSENGRNSQITETVCESTALLELAQPQSMTSATDGADSLLVPLTPVVTEEASTAAARQDSGDGRNSQITEMVCESTTLLELAQSQSMTSTTAGEDSSTAAEVVGVGVNSEADQLDQLMPLLQQGDVPIVAVILRSSMSSVSNVSTSVHNTVIYASSSLTNLVSTVVRSDSSSATSTTMAVSNTRESVPSSTSIVTTVPSNATSVPSTSASSTVASVHDAVISLASTAASVSSPLTSVTSSVTPVSTAVSHVSNVVNSVPTIMTSSPLTMTVSSSVTSVPGAVASTVTSSLDTPVSLASTVISRPDTMSSVIQSASSSSPPCTVTSGHSTTAPASTHVMSESGTSVSTTKMSNPSTFITQIVDNTAAAALLVLASPSTKTVRRKSPVSSAQTADTQLPSLSSHTSPHIAAGGSSGPMRSMDDSFSEDELHIVLQDDSFVDSQPADDSRLEEDSEPVESCPISTDPPANDASPNDKMLSVSDSGNGSCGNYVCPADGVVLRSSAEKSLPVSLHTSAVASISTPSSASNSNQSLVFVADSSSTDWMPSVADMLAEMSLFRPLSPIPSCQQCSLCDSVSEVPHVRVLRKRTITKRKLSVDDDSITPAKISASSDHV